MGLNKLLKLGTKKLMIFFFIVNSFRRSESEHTFYAKPWKIETLLVSLYVEDLMTKSNVDFVFQFKKEMEKIFKITNIGGMRYFLGIQVYQSKHEIFLTQKKYVGKVYIKFDMDKCKSVPTPFAMNLKLLKNDGVKAMNPN